MAKLCSTLGRVDLLLVLVADGFVLLLRLGVAVGLDGFASVHLVVPDFLA